MMVAIMAARASLPLFSTITRTGQPQFSQLSACRWQSCLHRGHGIQSIPSPNLPQAEDGVHLPDAAHRARRQPVLKPAPAVVAPRAVIRPVAGDVRRVREEVGGEFHPRRALEEVLLRELLLGYNTLFQQVLSGQYCQLYPRRNEFGTVAEMILRQVACPPVRGLVRVLGHQLARRVVDEDRRLAVVAGLLHPPAAHWCSASHFRFPASSSA